MSIVNELAKAVEDFSKDSKQSTLSFKKEELSEFIEMSLAEHRGFIGAVGTQNPSDMADFAKMIKTGKGPAVEAYKKFVKELKGGAKKDEDKAFLASLVAASKAMVDVLQDLQGNLDEFFKNKSVSIENTKVSHVMLFGILIESDVLSRFGTYLLISTTAEVSPNVFTAPYRVAFIEKNYSRAAAICNRAAEKKGASRFTSIVQDIRKNGADLFVANGGTDLMGVNSLNASASALTQNGILGLPNIFKWIGQKWIAYRDSRYRRMEKEREHMEGHIALLKMRLERVPSNDPEYLKKVKIIDNWTEQLNELDQDIAKYNR